jgi:mannosylglycoprotein endo-beta-mannosidase
MAKKYLLTGLLSVFSFYLLLAQDGLELNSGWKCQAIGKVKADGGSISQPKFATQDWLQATVPGTVLTTLINNHLEPDPFYGMNNQKIPDIYTTGRDQYTYWFVRDFKEAARGQVWLHFRGVNYGCDVWLNGHKLNAKTHYGMFLRQTYNITPYLTSAGGMNRLAVLVYPPDPVGNPNGGQGGDGEIARNVSHQYVAGWDWIQPIADRNTGIWDKVTIEKTGDVRIIDPHVVTEVPGIRYSDDSAQAPAILKVSATLENVGAGTVDGLLNYEIEGHKIFVSVKLAPGEKKEVRLPDYLLQHPRLWWPNGYGAQAMYHSHLVFGSSDTAALDFGVRQLTTRWNEDTHSLQLEVNGQKIFIKGGNWIVSDELLRFTPQRYDAEIRFHRDMNLNLIRVWGGALTERPEFYAACDKYGMLVFQDFWNSGDCNGRWEDPMKKEDQWTRRKYPDDHDIFIASAADQVKMLRNHPSLAFWCGGNEITPPEDILHAMRDSLMPMLDGTRYFIDFSNSDSMSSSTLGGNGDGPYGIQNISTFWGKRTFPFNSEVGSVGMGDYESLERFLPAADLVPPSYPGKENPVWNYHKYIGYDSSVYAYGPIKDLRDYAEKAQLVNFDQYRALEEGFSAHMWDWYTGEIIWKTQNPWTALRGQMYDYYLDVNACLYGLHHGSQPLHIMYNPVTGMVMIVNNTFRTQRDLMMQLHVYDMDGKDQSLGQQFEEIGPTTVKNYVPIGRHLDALRRKEGIFLSLRLVNTKQQIVSDNLYWLPDSTGMYSGLQRMGKAAVTVEARSAGQGRIVVTLRNPAGGPVAFFNRVSLVDPGTHQRILPVFYSDNYISVLPGESQTITLDYTPVPGSAQPLVSVRGWNVESKEYATAPR